MLQSEIRNRRSPSEIMAKMNQSLKETLPKRAFVALSFAHINLRDKILTHFNAALPEPILLRRSEPVELPIQSAAPLGGPLRAEYVRTSVPLCAGDVLILFSDGLPEARDVNEQEYEKGRLWTVLSSLAAEPQPAGGWVGAIRNDVRAFTGAGGLADDLTVVVVRVL